jgi:undecaprenyl-diphosphatase
VFFWKDLVQIIGNAFSSKKIGSKGTLGTDYPKNLFWILIVATIPGAVAGVLLEKQAESIFRNPLLIAVNLVVFGIIIWAIDRYSTKNHELSGINYKSAIKIGLAQMLAIVPGVSRSGSTMAAGRAIGLTRPDSARFSFLLSAPIMLGTSLYEFRHVTKQMADLGFFIGIIASAIVGFIAIKYLLKYLQKGNYAIFTWYRIILAIIVVIVYFVR